MAEKTTNWFQRRLYDFIVWLIAGYTNLAYQPARYQHINQEAPIALQREGRPLIGAAWHNRLILAMKVWPNNQQLTALVSQHGDGELIARIYEKLGHKTVRGSSIAKKKKRKDRGGGAAFRHMIRLLKEGASMGLTPDGPKGPRYRAKDGIILMAKYSGAPIQPVAYSARWAITAGSWDRMMVPLPFTRGVVIWGNPIEVPRDADADTLEALRLDFEKELLRITNEADRMVGRTPIEPADQAPPPKSKTASADVQQIA